MKVKFLNAPYFIFILLCAGITVGLYFLLKNKSMKTKKIVIFSLLLLNFSLHFLKLLFPPYNESLQAGLTEVFAVNICAVSVLVFPFIFLSKNDGAKDFMFYMGALGGGLAMLIPTEAIDNPLLFFDNLRFYTAHMIIFVAPMLMVLLKVHSLNYRRIWKMPLYMMVYFMFIMVNQIVQSELGIVPLRNSNFLSPNYDNPSFFWKKSNDPLFAVINIFTPKFLTIVPFGEFAGQTKYMPLVYIFPAVIVYFTVLPFLLALPFEYKRFWSDLKLVGGKIKSAFTKSKKME